MTLNSASDRHELLAHDVRRECATLVERPIGGEDVQRRASQCLMESSVCGVATYAFVWARRAASFSGGV